jgi:hypothetical protein
MDIAIPETIPKCTYCHGPAAHAPKFRVYFHDLEDAAHYFTFPCAAHLELALQEFPGAEVTDLTSEESPGV